MSAINDALSQLAEKNSTTCSGLQRADVKPVKQRAILPWVVGSFALSLCVGGWAISQQDPQVISSIVDAPAAPVNAALPTRLDSPTAKSVPASSVIYQSEVVEQPVTTIVRETDITEPQISKPTHVAATSSVVKATQQHSAQINPQRSVSPVPEKPQLIAKVATPKQDASASLITSEVIVTREVIVEQVELTPQQLAEKAKQRAKKSLDANNLKDALNAYNEALRYTPNDAIVRKKLSALYYGKGEVRKAVDLLQKGISLNTEDESLRLALSKLLIKEKQNAAALSVLVELPPSVSVDYLSLRAALAQKLKQNAIALESYQKLVVVEPTSGRWWLGLAIQQERDFDLPAAKASYTQAQNKLGLSSQSQQFIQDRLALIQSLEEQPSEN